MKRVLFAILLLAMTIPAAAQEKPPEGEFGPIGDGARQLVIEFLELDDAQTASWDILWNDHRDAEIPLKQQIADVQMAIEDLFASGSPDPADLGLLMIDRRALGEALIDVHVVYVEGFQFLLDDDQAKRLHQLRVADRIQGFLPAFRAFELVKR